MSGTKVEAVGEAAVATLHRELESVEVVLSLLEHLAAARWPVGVSEVAKALGLSKPRAHRHLRALVSRG